MEGERLTRVRRRAGEDAVWTRVPSRMPLPENCCFCFDLELGTIALSILSIISYATIVVVSYLGYDDISVYLYPDSAAAWVHGITYIWCLIGVLITFCLLLGITSRDKKLIKVYLVFGCMLWMTFVVRNLWAFHFDPIFAIKFLVINCINAYLWTCAYSIHISFKEPRLLAHAETSC